MLPSLMKDYVMDKPLNKEQILELVDKKARVVTHPEIENARNADHYLDQLMGKHGACIILYVTNIMDNGSAYGHWCALFRAGWRPDTLSYFDPYGAPPDTAISKMSPEAIAQYGQDRVLSSLLKRCRYRVVYNIAPLQEHQPGNAICGRLVGLRLQFRDIDGNRFAQLLTSYPNLSSDDVATLMTAFVR
jgi:hypothetical protein